MPYKKLRIEIKDRVGSILLDAGSRFNKLSITTIRELKREADRVVCLATPEPFYAIGEFYEDFEQTTDEEVIELLKRCREVTV